MIRNSKYNKRKIRDESLKKYYLQSEKEKIKTDNSVLIFNISFILSFIGIFVFFNIFITHIPIEIIGIFALPSLIIAAFITVIFSSE